MLRYCVRSSSQEFKAGGYVWTIHMSMRGIVKKKKKKTHLSGFFVCLGSSVILTEKDFDIPHHDIKFSRLG
jgi:hypothetical protein